MTEISNMEPPKEGQRSRRKWIILFIILAVIFFPIKRTLNGNYEFTVIDENGDPKEGVEICQEWSWGDLDAIGKRTLTVKTGKDGKARLPERSRYTYLGKIIKLEAVGCAKMFVNYDIGDYSTFKIDGMGRGIEREYWKAFDSDVEMRVVLGKCNKAEKCFCYYQCKPGECTFIETRCEEKKKAQ